jgi:hypothetical protein
VPITTNVVSSNPAQMRRAWYNIMWYSLSVTCNRSGVSLGTPVSSTKKNWPTRYNWNIVVSGIKHHKPNPQPLIYISIVVADPIIMKGRLGSHYINQFKPVTFLCLSQARTWISIGICHGLFLCSMIRGKDGCLFLWYWWNCWPSLFKLFFHKSLLLSLLQNKDIMWKCIYILY